MQIQPTKTTFEIVTLMMRLFPNLRLRRKVLTDQERAVARARVDLLSKLYGKLAVR